jgi:hypothetical protein
MAQGIWYSMYFLKEIDVLVERYMFLVLREVGMCVVIVTKEQRLRCLYRYKLSLLD